MDFDQLVFRQNADAGAKPSQSFLDESRVPQMIAGNAFLQAFGTFIVFSRAYSRLVIVKNWKVEDYVLIVAWVFGTAYSACQYGQIAHGAGRHTAALSNFEDAVTSQKYAFAAQLILFFALALPKISICLSYIRIFYSDKTGRRLIQGVLVFLILSIVPFFIEALFQCKPISLYWDELRPVDKCLVDLPALYVNGSMNVFADLALMGIVGPRIISLKMNHRQKWALMGIISLGSFVAIAGIVRMVRVGTALSKYNTTGFDPSWDSYDVSIWTSVEIYVALICAAAPGIKPLVSKILPKLLGTSYRSRSRTTGAPTGNAYELNSKMKRTTGSHFHKSVSMTGLTKPDNPYSSIGRGTDQESIEKDYEFEERSRQPSPENGIVKTQQVIVQTSDLR
ncbi:hypothetical protein K491DRAFT_713641 [Lophiostoma macrostomum CBS 122681]|uniref:Rhodopsin domain-containing protein n=1 Tax=Lophiostoma macrostomum CBS 122681 TaxID=1314788 RepID=A0A6A6TE22_9PLEO|nr:hypothetical protein K491DRAFT_713641 [Lophiostoma macrostomum CBS 122681]